MESPSIQMRIENLTELDRLEFIKIVGADAARFEPLRPADGRLGEMGTLTAILPIAHDCIVVLGTALAIWLSRGGKKVSIRDHIVIVTPDGRVERTLKIQGSSQEAISQEVIQQLLAALPATGTTPKPPLDSET